MGDPLRRLWRAGVSGAVFTVLAGIITLVAPATRARANTPFGLIKICKVAGPGVTVGAPFTFTAAGTYTVPAGPVPGGTGVLGPSVATGVNVNIVEQIPAGIFVSSIVVVPASRLASGPNLAAGSVGVTAGLGVTEVTYTDYAKTGWLEICKQGPVGGAFTFTVTPGGAGPITVPAGAFSPAIQVPAGQVVITENVSPNSAIAACSTFPGGLQGPCNSPPHTDGDRRLRPPLHPDRRHHLQRAARAVPRL